MEPELAELMSLLRRAETASGALRDLHDQWRAITSATGPCTATDTTGSVRASLGADGVPESIVLLPDWRRLVGAEGLAAAVTEACLNAVFAGLEALGTAAAEHSALDQHSDELFAFLDGTAPPPPWLPANDPHPPGPPRETPPMADLDDLAARIADGEWTGAAAQGRLTLTVDLAGVVTCQADPGWVTLQSTEQLNDSLAVALASALEQRPTWNW